MELKQINSFAAKFQTSFVVCFVLKRNYCLEPSLYVKLKDWTSNSVDPYELAHYEPSHLDLCCLQKPIIISYGSERVKAQQTVFPLGLIYTSYQQVIISILRDIDALLLFDIHH